MQELPETRPLFEGHETRVTGDYPIRSVETVEELPREPDWLNIEPSRFGSVQSLFETIEYCHEHGIRMFGGGQFELDVGREHLHAIASLFARGAFDTASCAGGEYYHPPSNHT